jgi:hypothetical protein
VLDRFLILGAVCAGLVAWIVGVTVRVIPREFDLTSIVAFAGLGSVIGATVGLVRRDEDPARMALYMTALFGSAAAIALVAALVVELFS